MTSSRLPLSRYYLTRARTATRVLALPLAISAAILLAGVFAVDPVRDAVTLAPIADVALARPDTYVDFAPFSNVLDVITLLSERQHIAVLLGLVMLWCVWRMVRRRGGSHRGRSSLRSLVLPLATIAAMYVAAAFLPRPMASLVVQDPDVLRIDFHSHTSSSLDARASYTIERSRAWHHAGGYDVAYVTDHQTFRASERALATNPKSGNHGVILLPGIEGRASGEHVGVLGAESVSRCVLSTALRDVDLAGAGRGGCCRTCWPVVVWNHPRDARLQSLPVGHGPVRAIEIANGALRGMDLVRLKRQAIVGLARANNLAVLSGSDGHGWGYAAPNWTLMRLTGWRALPPTELAARIEQAIKDRGFSATQVVERATADPGQSGTALALSVFIVPWRMLTEQSAAERRMWLLWTWLIAAALSLAGRRDAPWRAGLPGAGRAVVVVRDSL